MDLKTRVEQKKAATGKLTASIPFTLEEARNRKAHLCGQSRGEEWEWTAGARETFRVMEVFYIVFSVAVTQ